MRTLALLLHLLLFLFPATLATASGVIFRPLGDLPGGAFSSQAIDVSANGEYVVGQANTAAGATPFYWSLGGGMQAVPAPANGLSSSNNNANGVSNDGVVVGVVNTTDGFRSYEWDLASGATTADLIASIPGVSISIATDIQAAGGRVVGYETTSGDDRGYYADRVASAAATAQAFDESPWRDTRARSISDDGVIVGSGATTAFGDLSAFRWTETGGFEELERLEGFANETVAYGISDNGNFTVGESIGIGASRAVRWVGTTARDLGLLPGASPNTSFNRAYDASGPGTTVVGQADDAAGEATAFFYDSDFGMQSLQDILETRYGLDLTGWKLERASSISADRNVVVGRGTNPDGNREAWLVDLNFISPAGPGDLNADGLISIDDYLYWRENFGTPGSAFVAKSSFNTSVLDVADYTLWRDAYGGGAGPVLVPEPATGVIGLLLAVLTAAARRTR